MNYAEIYKDEICNGLGVGVSLYVSGCDMNPHCPGCFNSEAWDFNYGEPFTKEVEQDFFASINKSYIDRVSLLGGDPMSFPNYKDIYNLCRDIRKRFGDTKKIWLYSGYTFEYLMSHLQSVILPYLDVLVDGRFIESEKDATLAFRGSRSQRIILVPESLKFGKIIEMEEKQT